MIVCTAEYITTSILHDLRVYLQTIADGNATTWLIMVGTEDEEYVRCIVEKIAPNEGKGQFKAKWIDKSVCKNYQVIDNEEVWISLRKTQQRLPMFSMD